MQREKRETFLNIDKQLCIGCGICVDACPTSILDVQDGVCILLIT